MGNALDPGLSADGEDCERCLSELKGFEQVRALGGGRLLRSYLCRAGRSGRPVVVKIFAKRPERKKENKTGGSINLEPYVADLTTLRAALKDQPCLAPLDLIINNPQGLHLGRQYFASSLYDWLLALPRPTEEEKRFICYQLMSGVRACHGQEVCHGDITCENVMINSWGWVVLTDFALHKPKSLYADDPATYDRWFETGERTRCYVAPERFRERDQKLLKALSPACDIFSLGCCIAEVFLDGEALFNREQLLMYRKNRFSPTKSTSRIKNADARAMVTHMTQLDPKKRESADRYMRNALGKFIPFSYRFLYPFFQKLATRALSDSDARVLYIAMESESIARELDVDDDVATLSLAASVASLEVSIKAIQGASTVPPTDVLTRRLEILRDFASLPPLLSGNSTPRSKGGGGIEVVLVALLSYIPLCRFPSSKIVGLGRVKALSRRIRTLSLKLDSILPVVLELTNDPDASVRCAAIRACISITQQLPTDVTLAPTPQISSPPPIHIAEETQVFTRYVFPTLAPRTTDHSQAVRVAYSKALEPLSTFAAQFHEKRAIEAINCSREASGAVAAAWERHAFAHNEARTEIKELAGETARKMLHSIGNAREKRGLVRNIVRLMVTIGKKRVNEKLLRAIVPPLNDPDWQLRASVIVRVQGMSVFIGYTGCSKFLLPCLVESLKDAEESVVFQSVQASTTLAELGLIKGREYLASMADAVGPLLCHPQSCLRQVAADFLHQIGKQISRPVVYASVRPKILPFLLRPPGLPPPLLELSRTSLRVALRPPLTTTQVSATILASRHSNPDTAGLALSRLLGEQNASAFARRMARYIVDTARAARTVVSDSKASGAPQGGGGGNGGDPREIPAKTVWRTKPKRRGNSARKATSAEPKSSLKVQKDSKKIRQKRTLEPPAPNHPPPAIPGDPDTEEAESRLLLSESSRALSNLLHALTLSETETFLGSFSKEGGGGRMGTAIVVGGHKGDVTDLSAGPHSRYYVSSGKDNYVRIWNASQERLGGSEDRWEARIQCEISQNLGNQITSVTTTQTSTVACGLVDGSISMFQISQGSSSRMPLVFLKPRRVQPDGKSLRHGIAAMESHGPLIISGTNSGVIRVWDPRSSHDRPEIEIDLPNQMGILKTLAIGPGNWGYCLGAGSASGTIALWDLRYTLQVASYSLPSAATEAKNRSFSINSLAISSAGGSRAGKGWLWAAIGGLEPGVGAYDIETGTPSLNLDGYLIEFESNPISRISGLYNPYHAPQGRNVVPRSKNLQRSPGGPVNLPRSLGPNPRDPQCVEVSADGTEIITTVGSSVYLVEAPLAGSIGKKELPIIHTPPRRYQGGRSDESYKRREARAKMQTELEKRSLTGGGITSLTRLDDKGLIVAGCKSGALLMWA
ncbi:hypothetical protein AAMO2058_000081900 [Amorphochlora amoebiformis]